MKFKDKEKFSENALRIEVPKTTNVAIIGGGAAGLAAAVMLSRFTNMKFCILDKSYRIGSPILATGNGRCNFANVDMDPSFYNDPEFAECVLGDTPKEDICRFFDSIHLAYTVQDGRYFPRTFVSESVRRMLIDAAKINGVAAPMREVTEIKEWGPAFKINYKNNAEESGEVHQLIANRILIAPGGGEFDFIKNLGVSYEECRPVLCALKTSWSPLMNAAGRRSRAKLTLIRDGEEIAAELGEVFIKSEGLSGISIFNLSRFAWPEDQISIDFIPEIESEDANNIIVAKMEEGSLKSCLDGMIDPYISKAILDSILENNSFETIDDAAKYICGAIKDYRLSVIDFLETENSQVTAGGILTNEINPETLELKDHKGIYVAGECINIDGACGGYNLGFAWLSGLRAADSIHKSLI